MIKILISMIPELLKLLWTAYKRHKNGADSKQIKRSMQKINSAFKNKNRGEAHEELTQIWNDHHNKH